MRGFIILCLATIATAAPQYNYGQPTGGHTTFGGDVASGLVNSIFGGVSGGSSTGGGGASTSGHFGGGHFGSGSIGSGSIGSGSIGSGSIGSGSIGSGSIGGGHFAGDTGHGGSIGFGGFGIGGGAGHGIGGGAGHGIGGGQIRHKQTIYHKNIYIHSAPDDDLSEASSRAADSLTERKHVNVVFIKTPENRGLENAALELAKSASEEKTNIYVLNKQTDLNELKSKVDQIQESVVSKPQVHFVKYKTAEEAEYAQRAIQSSYDQLTGPTQVSNEGIAPVQNFVGALGGQASGVYANGRSGQGASYAPQQQYLPPGPSYLPA